MKTLRILAISLMTFGLMACGAAQDENSVSLNEDTLQVAYIETLNCEDGLQANLGVMGGDPGGTKRSFTMDSNKAIFSIDSQTCAGYIWEVSGECTNCGDILVEFGDESAVIEVGEGGEFTFTMQTMSYEAPLLITPMRDGVLGLQIGADLLLDF